MSSVEVVQATPFPVPDQSARSTQASEKIIKPAAPAAVITVHEEPKVLDVDERVLQAAAESVVDQAESAEENDHSSTAITVEELIQSQAQEVVAVPTQEIPPEADEETETVLVIDEEKQETPVQVEESKAVESSPPLVEKTTEEVEEEEAATEEKPAVAEVKAEETEEEATITETATTEEEAKEAESSLEEVPAPKLVEDQSATVDVVLQETAEEIKVE